VCAQGLEWGEEVDFTVPEPRYLVRDDLAVVWGLDRIRAGSEEVWSRGTRVFQKRDGRWLMVHQHLSYPQDPETGMARMDLKP